MKCFVKVKKCLPSSCVTSMPIDTSCPPPRASLFAIGLVPDQFIDTLRTSVWLPRSMPSMLQDTLFGQNMWFNKFQDVHFSHELHRSDQVLIELLRLCMSVAEDWIPASLYQSTSLALESTYQPDSAPIELKL